MNINRCGFFSVFKHGILIPCFCIIILLSHTEALRAQDDQNLFNPENSSLLYIYGGYGYYNWKMMSMEGFIDIFSSDMPSSGIMFEHKATPYTVKKYGVKSNFLIFSLGLDYMGDTLGLPTDIDSEEKYEDREDEKVRQLRYLSGLGFGDVSFQFNVTYREFDSKITSQGYKPLSGGPLLPIYYYPESGGQVLLNDGDETAWYTTYTDYEGKIVIDGKFNSMEFGVRYVRYDAPTELKISESGSSGDILMFTENKMISLFMAGGGLVPVAGDFYLKYYIPVNIAGYYYAENDYFEVKNKMPFSTDTFSMTASSSGTLALAYMLKYMRLEAGADYGFCYSKLMLTDAELKKDVEYPDNYSGAVMTADAGDRVQIEATRVEVFWGFYLHASVFF